jgi:hypothetical protein
MKKAACLPPALRSKLSAIGNTVADLLQDERLKRAITAQPSSLCTPSHGHNPVGVRVAGDREFS